MPILENIENMTVITNNLYIVYNDEKTEQLTDVEEFLLGDYFLHIKFLNGVVTSINRDYIKVISYNDLEDDGE